MSRSVSSKQLIADMARAEGFDAVGFAPPALPEQAGEDLRIFIEKGFHGEMSWLAERMVERSHPWALWSDVKSIIVLGMNYGPEQDPLPELEAKDCGYISVYARNRDYHDVVKGKLKQLAGKIVGRFGGQVKVFVDTAPVMEKPLAELAGIGWQGKHSCVVSRQHGSWLFLGVIYTTLELAPDAPEAKYCGRCSACITICPTQAIVAPHQLDARRCISYLTIEHKGSIDEELRPLMGNRIYGCDDCLAVCPWNKFASTATEAKFHAREALNMPALSDLLQLDEAGFRSLFAASPIKRIGWERFMRNVLIAAGNSGDQSLTHAIAVFAKHQSTLLAEHAKWALGRLLPN
ncbi:tRNA epoxyqueuosine(34) reductase QueG [bacterium]|nr:tRNA epoxyqueuosine(34) reductase QueG [bacterium]